MHRALVLFFLVGCGGATVDPSFDGGGGGDDGGLSKSCPSSLPGVGSSCVVDGLECEYGGDARWTCNTVTRCSGGSWEKVVSNDSTCPTPSTNPASCPATRQQAAGACSVSGTACNYEGHWCECGWQGGPWPIDGGPQFTWQCGGATFQDCPSVRPRVGSACSHAKLFCDYGVCGAPQGLSVECNGATWSSSPGPVCAKAD